MGNYHARCGAGEKPEVATPEAYLSLFALPDDYCSLLSTMRSREISSIIIIQNLAQIKALFKDTWETIPGNSDTLIYLGGNEQGTHKYISELLGKGTIDKKSSGETKGRQGSSSRNYDVLGRELFTPDEVRKLDNKKCLIFVRGFDPIIDEKFIPFGHPAFDMTADGKGLTYTHESTKSGTNLEKPYQILTDKSMGYYKRLKEKGETVYIDNMDYTELEVLTEFDVKKRFRSLEETEQKEKLYREQDNVLEYSLENTDTSSTVDVSFGKKAFHEKYRIQGEDTIMNRIAQWDFTREQKDEMHKMMAIGMSKEEILSIFYPETEVAKMREIRRTYGAVKNQIRILQDKEVTQAAAHRRKTGIPYYGRVPMK